MSDVIQLRLCNESNDANNSQIVIFQKNVATNMEELAVAWRVIEHLGRGNNHPFTYSTDLEVSANDSWGNYTPSFAASPGQLWHMALGSSGNELTVDDEAASSPSEVQLRNDLMRGAIEANVLRDGKLLATKTGIAPGQKAVFLFKPMIYVGVVSQVEEGEVMDSAILSENVGLSLLGISRADIVMRGGGPGRSSSKFTFTLENVEMQ